ncbi:hypothetical protein [Saccharolobus solfataricus]|uniref:Uncharacterized protein n=1 Tax=Saccharolobus solfataricus TaxID=2287 RepID=A0A7S9IJ08_SACSO|nr:hypothetical protein [Saccharolobus solfataricus]QPG50073.1 hypothetical protein HFC64_09800 [Saccharolobus solfataricus]
MKAIAPLLISLPMLLSLFFIIGLISPHGLIQVSNTVTHTLQQGINYCEQYMQNCGC